MATICALAFEVPPKFQNHVSICSIPFVEGWERRSTREKLEHNTNHVLDEVFEMCLPCGP